ncbi:MAG: methylmalonyl-CoA mutase family protein, partial [Pseudomonadota bacterium]
MAETDLEALNRQFSEAGDEAWRALVEKALKGRDFDRALRSPTLSGVTLDPLYAPAANADPVVRQASRLPWVVAQRVDAPTPEASARQAIVDLEGGAGGLVVAFAGAPVARGAGVNARTTADLEASLKGVALEMITVDLEPSSHAADEASLVADLVRHRGLKPTELDIVFGLAPFVGLLRGQAAASEIGAETDRAFECVSSLKDAGFAGPFLACDVRAVHDAGGSEVHELATALTLGVASMKAMVAAGMSLADAERALHWIVPIDADQIMGLAKLRALRKLWARVQEASGLAPRPIRIRAETSWRMMCRRDPATNMLRGTIAAFVAGVGGADVCTVLPHTIVSAAGGAPDAHARRIARNTGLILLEEANLWRVADPSAGAGAIEDVTEQLAEAAWGFFQTMTATQSPNDPIGLSVLGAAVKDVSAERAKAFAEGRRDLTGVTSYPSLESLADIEAMADDTTGALDAGPLGALMRDAEPFEQLAAETLRRKSKSGIANEVVLIRLGSVADHGARAAWIENRLAVAGIGCVGASDGATTSG